RGNSTIEQCVPQSAQGVYLACRTRFASRDCAQGTLAYAHQPTIACCSKPKRKAFTMNYRYLGKTVLKVSELCLGAMTFGRESPEAESKQVLNRFIELGGNFIDTANVYS